MSTEKKKINQPQNTENLPNTKVLTNGAVYDMDKHRIVDSTNAVTKFTKENAGEMQARAVAKKRLVMHEAANGEVQDKALIEKYGEYAHVAERAVVLQRIATTPEAGKAAIMAHDALVRDTGMSEKQTEQPQRPAADPLAHALDTLISLLADNRSQTVDGEVTLIRNEIGADETEQ